MGYSLPYLDRFSADTERTFAFMPAGQGAVAWPSIEKTATALVFDEELPLPDSSIDRVLMVHALEYAENPTETLKEMWRVLAPNGRLVIVVPNRRGLWARFEHTPFGSGRPYSRTQLTTLLREANFTVSMVSDALHFPPATRRWMMRPCLALEGMGRRLWPVFSGVLVVEAQKRLYQGLPVAQRSSVASSFLFSPHKARPSADCGKHRHDPSLQNEKLVWFTDLKFLDDDAMQMTGTSNPPH